MILRYIPQLPKAFSCLERPEGMGRSGAGRDELTSVWLKQHDSPGILRELKGSEEKKEEKEEEDRIGFPSLAFPVGRRQVHLS